MISYQRTAASQSIQALAPPSPSTRPDMTRATESECPLHPAGCRRQNTALREAIHQHCVLSGVIERGCRDPYLSRSKRLFDILSAAILIAALAPIFALLAVAIKLDSPGPVLFRQHRTGYLGRRFPMYKFRTMVKDADQLKSQLMHLNVHTEDSPDFKIKNDPRITRVGKILRRSSLDELPNLFNVILGDMSLVGPRPTSFHASTYRTQHLPRLAAKPGITGLWQVSGRADVDFDTRTTMDVEYIRTASFFVDAKLIVLTLLRLRSGAY
jgi:lipopolysaccharide/colanic/teichoic acid biosynthesis glycosyltransferase